MLKSLAFFATLCVSLSDAFKMRQATTAMRPHMLRMSTADNMAGVVAPTGFFDPLGLSKDLPIDNIRKYRESELKHGRIAMLAFLGILVGESGNTPLFNGQITGPAIYQFQQADAILPTFWILVTAGITVLEFLGIRRGWESPEETMERTAKEGVPYGVAELKPNYVNGDLGFDPLKFSPKTKEGFANIRTKELSNGRLAMLGVAGMVAQELVNGKGIVENFSG